MSGLYFVFQVGIAACQIARAHGLKVLGTAGSEEGKKLVLQNGAHEVFDHKEVNYIDKIKVKFSTVLKSQTSLLENLLILKTSYFNYYSFNE